MIRTRMTETKINMKGKHKEYMCDACESENIQNEDSQEHIYTCHVLMRGNDMTHDEIPRYSIIFTEDTNKMKLVQKVFMTQMKSRDKIINSKKQAN